MLCGGGGATLQWAFSLLLLFASLVGADYNICYYPTATNIGALSLPANSPTGLVQRVPPVCASPWTNFDGRCYLHSSNAAFSGPSTATFTDAETACNSVGAHLVSISTLRENCFIFLALNTSGGAGVYNYTGSLYTWIGLAQRASGNGLDYGWMDGSTYDPVPRRNGGFSPWGIANLDNFGLRRVGPSCNADWYLQPVVGADVACCLAAYNITLGYATQLCPRTGTRSCTCPSGCTPDGGGGDGWPADEANICNPNHNNIGSGQENCGTMWRYDKSTYGEWNDGPCSNAYPYVCAKIAMCRAGYQMITPYTGMPVRSNLSLVRLPRRFFSREARTH